MSDISRRNFFGLLAATPIALPALAKAAPYHSGGIVSLSADGKIPLAMLPCSFPEDMVDYRARCITRFEQQNPFDPEAISQKIYTANAHGFRYTPCRYPEESADALHS